MRVRCEASERARTDTRGFEANSGAMQRERARIWAAIPLSQQIQPKFARLLGFLTNNPTLPAPTIAAFYQSHWQVELFRKWIKQHLRIKKFLSTSENAVKTQIWCAVSIYALIAIVKKELQLDVSLYPLLPILSVSIFEQTP